MSNERPFEYTALAGTGHAASVRVLIQVAALSSDTSDHTRSERRAVCETLADSVARSASTLGIALSPTDLDLAEAIDQL